MTIAPGRGSVVDLRSESYKRPNASSRGDFFGCLKLAGRGDVSRIEGADATQYPRPIATQQNMSVKKPL